jgi:hypothetical protein
VNAGNEFRVGSEEGSVIQLVLKKLMQLVHFYGDTVESLTIPDCLFGMNEGG